MTVVLIAVWSLAVVLLWQMPARLTVVWLDRLALQPEVWRPALERLWSADSFAEGIDAVAAVPVSGWPQLVTYTLLHGGPLHLVNNAIFLWVFGSRLEDRAGKLRFLLFYVVCGAVSGLVQCGLGPADGLPVVGASGAVAGAIAAFVLFHRRARILLLIPVVVFPVFVEIPVILLALVWFVLQLRPVQTLLAFGAGTPTAWHAHVGGFLCGGLLAVLLWQRRARPAPPAATAAAAPGAEV